MKIRMLLLILLTALTTRTAISQDGSDILYRTVDQLDMSYMGSFVHLDFYNKSFRGASLDTVTIVIDNEAIKFIENRKDNGYNNWFGSQYLESLKKTDKIAVRVVKCRLDKMTADSIFVTNYIEYYKDEKLIPDKSKRVSSKFPRTIIAEVLVSSNSHKERKK